MLFVLLLYCFGCGCAVVPLLSLPPIAEQVEASQVERETEREKKLCKHFVDRLRYVFQYSSR